MEDWNSMIIMAKQKQIEFESEANNFRMIKKSRVKKNRARKEIDRILNITGRFFESLGRALQKKAQTC